MSSLPGVTESQGQPPVEFKRELGLFSAIALVSGIMIGSGIFIVSADIARQMNSPFALLGVWVFTAVVTLFGAISYGKLAVAFPEAGGQYVFLKKCWGEIPAFLYGWALFFVIQSGTLAAVAVAFSKFLGVLCPQVSSHLFWIQFTPHLGVSSQQGVAILLLWVLTFYNCRGIKEGAFLQNLFTVLKTLAILGVVIAGFLLGAQPMGHLRDWVSHGAWTSPVPFWSAFAVATVGALFSADAWNNVTFVGGEIKNPQVNLPKAMTYGTLVVLLLYIVVNVAYLHMLPFSLLQHAPEERVATAAIRYISGGPGEGIMAAIILISTFGCLNGMILAGARVYYAMAQDKLFFGLFGALHPRLRTPIASLMGQGICASLLTLSGSYGQLLDYILFTTLFFYMLTVLGMLKLAWRMPETFRMVGWTQWIIPIVYVLLLAYVAINLALYKQQYTVPGLMIVAAGIPIYFVWKIVYPRFYRTSGQ